MLWETNIRIIQLSIHNSPQTNQKVQQFNNRFVLQMFFTNKKVNKLSQVFICYKLISQHPNKLQVEIVLVKIITFGINGKSLRTFYSFYAFDLNLEWKVFNNFFFCCFPTKQDILWKLKGKGKLSCCKSKINSKLYKVLFYKYLFYIFLVLKQNFHVI